MTARPVPARLGGDTFRPTGFGPDVPDVSNVGSMGPIQPETGATPTTGVAPAGHPELSASHRDARLTKVADVELNGEYTARPGAARTWMETSGAFTPSSQLTSGRQRDKHK